VLCRDASRLARNGRTWHHLLELCGSVGARVIDIDGIDDPHRPNDRLLLGIKGSISEFELGVIRARILDAKHGKALRGDLRITVPNGYLWHREIGLGLDPNLRVQEAVRVVFARFRQLSSARLECERRPGPGVGVARLAAQEDCQLSEKDCRDALMTQIPRRGHVLEIGH
jgi:DNA invertase Pin-like site-specific DNA recombinase